MAADQLQLSYALGGDAMEVVTVRRAVLVILAGLLVSCDGLFDSYYPATVEYLETQADLVTELGDKPVSSIRMRYLAATPARSTDLLVVAASTRDGDSHVVFYDPDTLEVRKAYGGSELRAVNQGQNPAIGLFAQDSTSVYTGQVRYTNSLKIVDGDSLATYIKSLPNPYLSNFYSTYDGANDKLALFVRDNARVGLESGSSLSLFATTPVLASNAFPDPNSSMLDAQYWDSIYYGIVTGAGEVYLVNGTDPLNWVPTTPPGPVSIRPESFETRPGELAWATSSAAIVRTYGENSVRLVAYSWSGKELGAVSIDNDEQTIALCFEPNGNFWYLFESSTGKLSRQKVWW